MNKTPETQFLIDDARTLANYRNRVDVIKRLYNEGEFTINELIAAVQTAAIKMCNEAADARYKFHQGKKANAVSSD